MVNARTRHKPETIDGTEFAVRQYGVPERMAVHIGYPLRHDWGDTQPGALTVWRDILHLVTVIKQASRVRGVDDVRVALQSNFKIRDM